MISGRRASSDRDSAERTAVPDSADILFELTGAIILGAEKATQRRSNAAFDVLTLDLEDGRQYQVLSGADSGHSSHLAVVERFA